jgi:hypothetical protein
MQNRLTQQQLAQSQQATQLGAARMDEIKRQATHEKISTAIKDIAGFNTREEVLQDMQRKLQSGELDHPNYQKVLSTLPPDNTNMNAWKTRTLRNLLSAKEQLDAMENDQASARLNETFGVGEPPAQQMQAPPAASMQAAPVEQVNPRHIDLSGPGLPGFDNETTDQVAARWNAAKTNNLAPAPAAPVNALAEQTLPPVAVTAPRSPTLPSLEQGMMMAGSRNKGEAEVGKRIVDYYEKQPELLKLQAQQNRLMQMGLTAKDPEMRAIQDAISKVSTHAAPIQINTGQQLEKAESVQKGASNIKLLDEVSNDARSSAKLLPAIDVAERIMNKGFETGFGTDAKVAGARLLSAFGVPEATKYASDAATMQAMLTQTVLQRQLEQKGVATEGDAQRIADTSAKLSNPVDANKYILSVARATIQRDQEKKDFFQKWWNTNKTVEGAEQAWDAGPANKSIFTYPALKAYAPATKPTAGPKTPIATAQDKAALDWANANPNDPRAAQIKSRLGQ